MNVISSGKFQEESIFSGTYTIVIDDFRKKLAAATVGRRSTTEEFIVNWTKFHIEFYIAGRSKEHKGYLSLFLSNRSDWMVRASMEIYVKVNIIVQSKEKEFGVVYNAKYGSGFGKCIPHSRCVVGDLLSAGGALIIKVKINMLGENCPGGIQTGLKRKLDEQDAKLNKQNSKLYTELLEIKSKLRKLEDNHGFEKCPMCLKVIKKPMRLQQCLQGHITCDDCYKEIKKKNKKDKVFCVIPSCNTEYCGRPTVLEKMLGLLDTTTLISSDSDSD